MRRSAPRSPFRSTPATASPPAFRRRSATIPCARSPTAICGAADFVRPGHVFPLVAKEGGVLMRSGHTEACVDLCRLAGLPPVGVLAELMNDDGTVMRGPELAAFAERHKLQRITIAELIAYRQARDKLIERVGEFPVESEIGTLDRLRLPDAVRSGLSHGLRLWPHRRRQERADAAASRQSHPRRVRRRQDRSTGRCERFKAEGSGVLCCLRDGAAGRAGDCDSRNPTDTASGEARTRQWREIGLGAQILKDLGVTSIRLHHLVAPHDLCRPVRLRHRNRRDGAGRRLTWFVCRQLSGL